MIFLLLALLISSTCFAKYDYPSNGVVIPLDTDTYEQFEKSINSKFDQMTNDIEDGEFAKALNAAKDMRGQVRKTLFKNPRLSNQVITIYTDDNISRDDLAGIAGNYMGGYFIDVLNLYKRVEMYYTYALIKRFTAGNRPLLEKDKELFAKTLAKVLDNEIRIIGSKKVGWFDSEKIVLSISESDFVDINENYLFNREIETYIRDLSINELNENEVTIMDLAQEYRLGFCKKRLINMFPGISTRSAKLYCENINYGNFNCALSELEKITIYRVDHFMNSRTIRTYNLEYRGNIVDSLFEFNPLQSNNATKINHAVSFLDKINSHCQK